MTTNGMEFSATKMVKLKKMINNIRKYYELIIAKSFWVIERISRADTSRLERSG